MHAPCLALAGAIPGMHASLRSLEPGWLPFVRAQVFPGFVLINLVCTAVLPLRVLVVGKYCSKNLFGS